MYQKSTPKPRVCLTASLPRLLRWSLLSTWATHAAGNLLLWLELAFWCAHGDQLYRFGTYSPLSHTPDRTKTDFAIRRRFISSACEPLRLSFSYSFFSSFARVCLWFHDTSADPIPPCASHSDQLSLFLFLALSCASASGFDTGADLIPPPTSHYDQPSLVIFQVPPLLYRTVLFPIIVFGFVTNLFRT